MYYSEKKMLCLNPLKETQTPNSGDCDPESQTGALKNEMSRDSVSLLSALFCFSEKHHVQLQSVLPWTTTVSVNNFILCRTFYTWMSLNVLCGDERATKPLFLYCGQTVHKTCVVLESDLCWSPEVTYPNDKVFTFSV